MSLTGRIGTRIVASRATISEMIANVIITRNSCLRGFHSAGISLAASTSWDSAMLVSLGGRDNVDAMLSVPTIFSSIIEVAM